MQDTNFRPRLKMIFATILGIPEGEVGAELSPQTCAKWDSLNQIHLVHGIEEEFEFEMPFEDQMRMLSFAVAEEIVSNAVGQQ